MAKGRKTGGRRPGSPNKIQAEVKAEIERAFQMVGGAEYLRGVAAERPEVFCALLGKVIPRDIHKTIDLGPQLADILREIAERRGRRDSSMGTEPAALRDGSVAGHA